MQLEKFDYTNSLRADGSRTKVYVDDIRGRFQALKNFVYPVLIAIFLLIPFVHIDGRRWFLLDIQNRQFFLFGLTGNAQDVYLVFFVVTGLAFTLFFITALFGRLWCGWACPQTVFLDGLFRRIERWIEGPRVMQLKLASQPWGFQKISKFLLKHGIYLLIALVLSLSFVSLFTTHETILDLFRSGVADYPVLFFWILAWTAIIYINFSWFREQLCLIVCPYGRLQSVLMDDDSLVIGYDEGRGEPRGKKSDASRGDCIDCHRCVVVCPTGIDIRNGMQMECVGCANCIDACDEIMEKVDQKPGLIRYDSLNGLENRPKKIFRPRIYVYTVLLFVGMMVSGFTLSQRTSFEANLLRSKGTPYVLQNQKITNQFDIHLFNKSNKKVVYTLVPITTKNERYILPIQEVELDSLRDRHLPLFVEIDQSDYFDGLKVQLKVEAGEAASEIIEADFLGPKQKK